jgi:hypothetical protein
MKIRQGFVSNSSSTSFNIFGFYFGQDEEDAYSFLNRLKYRKIESILVYNRYGDCVVGAGHIEYECDHGREDWESYVCPGPDEKQIESLKSFAREFGIEDKLRTYSDTFREG